MAHNKRGFIPQTTESKAKQEAILKSGIEQAEGKLPSGTRLFRGGGGISSSLRESRLREAKRKLEVIRKEKEEAKRIADQLKQKQQREERETARQEKAFTGTIAGQFKERDKPLIEFGVPFVKPSEERKLRREGSLLTTFEVKAKGIDEAFEESRRLSDVGGVQVAPFSLLPKTKEAFIFEQASVIGAKKKIERLKDIEQRLEGDPSSFIGLEGVQTKDVDGDKQVILTTEFFGKEFDFGKESIIEAKQIFEDLPKSSQRKAAFGSVITATSKLGIGLVEFGGALISSLGVQTFTEEEIKAGEFKPFSFGRQFSFGGEFGKIKRQPGLLTSVTFTEDPLKFIKEKSKSPQLITEVGGGVGLIALGGAGALKNIKQLGLGGGLIETAGAFSPLRIQSKIFTIPISESSELDVLSFKLKKGEFTTRSILGEGRNEPFKIESIQEIKQLPGKQEIKQLPGKEFEIGGIKTTLFQPATILKNGEFIEGIKVSKFEGLTKGYGGGKAFERKEFNDIVVLKDIPGFKGGLGESLTRPTFSAFIGSEGKGFSELIQTTKFKLGREATTSKELIEGLNLFGSGKRISIPEQKIFNDFDVVRQPSGKFKFKSTTSGFEFDLNKILKLKESDIGSIVGGSKGKSTPLSKTFEKQILTSQLSSVRSSLGLSSKVTPKLDLPTSKVGLGFGLPRSVGGQGLTESQLQIERGGLSQFSLPTGNQKGFIREDQSISSGLFSGISQAQIGRQETKQLGLSLQVPKSLSAQQQVPKQLSKQLQIPKQITGQLTQQEFLIPGTTPTPRGFDSFLDFGFGFGLLPPFPGRGSGGFGRRIKKKKRGVKTRISPSFTGIVADVQIGLPKETFLGGVDIGILPGQIRGIAKKKVKKKKKKR